MVVAATGRLPKACKRCPGVRTRHGSYCAACDRARQKERREQCPERVRKSEADYRKSAKGRRQRKSEAQKQAEEKYRKSAKGKAQQARADRKYNRRKQEEKHAELTRLRALLPIPVVVPYIEQLVRLYGDPKTIERMTGVSDKTIFNYREGRRKGARPDVIDKLAMIGDFTLIEVQREAEEWAERTGDPWPKGYGPGRKAKRAPLSVETS